MASIEYMKKFQLKKNTIYVDALYAEKFPVDTIYNNMSTSFLVKKFRGVGNAREA